VITLRIVLFWVGIGVGGLLVAVGAIAVGVLVYLNQRAKDYEVYGYQEVE